MSDQISSSVDPYIVCDNLVKIFKVADLEVVALQGLDLSVRKGELMAIIGNSGSGKSTLMNILGGLDRPSAGGCVVGGIDLAAVFVGGTSVFGGKGTIFGTFFGVLIIGSLEAGIVAMGLSGFWVQFIYGLMIILSVTVYAFLLRKKS